MAQAELSRTREEHQKRMMACTMAQERVTLLEKKNRRNISQAR